MPTLSPQTVRAFVFLRTGRDLPADELSYRIEPVIADGGNRPDFVHAYVIRSRVGAEDERVLSMCFELAGHSPGHVEREFVASVATYVTDQLAEQRIAYERLRDMIGAAEYSAPAAPTEREELQRMMSRYEADMAEEYGRHIEDIWGLGDRTKRK